MTTIHMETERVRETARLLDQWVTELYTKGATLKTASGMLSAAWLGSGAEDYHRTFNSWIKEYESQTQQLEDLTLRVSREADEWESVDRDSHFHDEGTPAGSLVNGMGSDWIASFFDNAGAMIDGAGLGIGLGAILSASTYIGKGLEVADLSWADDAIDGLGSAGDLLDFGGQAYKDWTNPGYAVDEKVMATVYDGGFTLVKGLTVDIIQGVVADVVILPAVGFALVVLPVAGPVAVIGTAAIGVTAVVAWWGTGELVDYGMDQWSEGSGFKDIFILDATNAARAVGNAADNLFDSTIDGITSHLSPGAIGS